MDSQTKKRRKYFFASIVSIGIIGLFLTYSNHFNNFFHFDDLHTIVSNPAIKSLSNIPKFFVDPGTTSSLPANQSYRPGVTLLNAIDYWIAGGLNPFWFHVSIFISFLFQALIMYLIFKRLLDISKPHKWNTYFALFIVCLYCYHKAIPETINYIISRSDSFSTLMVLLALYLYMFFPKKRKFYFYLIPFVFGFFVKEQALMFVPLLGLYIYLFEKKQSLTNLFGKKANKDMWLTIREVFPTFILGFFLFYLSQTMVHETYVLSVISRFNYLITQPFVYVHYFTTFLIPAWLSADTDWRVLQSVWDIRFFMGIMFLSGIIIMAFRLSKDAAMRPISFGLLWFLIALLPTSSFFPLSEVLNDHRLFFPYVGLSLALSYAAIYALIINREKYISENPYYLKLIVSAAILLIVLHAHGTYSRNKVWSSDETLWADVVKKSPKNGRGLMNYGLTYMRIGKYDEALHYFERGLIYNPYYSYLHINIALAKNGLRKPDAEIEKHYTLAVQYGQSYYGSYYYYGLWLKQKKRIQEALYYLEQAHELGKQALQVRYALMELYSELMLWDKLKKISESTLKLYPKDALAANYLNASHSKKSKLDMMVDDARISPTYEKWINISLEYYNAGLFVECINACERALEINPQSYVAYNNICSAWNQIGEYEKAAIACEKALIIKPGYETAIGNLNHANFMNMKLANTK